MSLADVVQVGGGRHDLPQLVVDASRAEYVQECAGLVACLAQVRVEAQPASGIAHRSGVVGRTEPFRDRHWTLDTRDRHGCPAPR